MTHSVPRPLLPCRAVDLPRLFSALQTLLTPAGVQASTDHLFKGAVFGRDSLRVAEDLLPWFPTVSRQVILTIAHLQGRETNAMSEEEPGRIHHEYRNEFLGCERVGREQREIMANLAERWGWLSEGRELCYYGTVDATPQFARLVCDYVSLYGHEILDQELRHRTGSLTTVRKCLLLALAWIAGRLDSSSLGLLEFRRANPLGLPWQVMRDGALSYAHEDGSLANAEAPIAALEVQGLAYDALTRSADLLEPERPEDAREWRRRADALREALFRHFWLPDREYFAMAIDRGPDGQPRPVRTASTVAGELLETGVFEGMALPDREQYVGAILRTLYSPEFLADAGLRSRGRRHWNLFGQDLWEYQGSRVTWAVMTNVVARGLRRQGLQALARDLENRLLNAAGISGTLAEFYYVDLEGRIAYDPKALYALNLSPRIIVGTNVPEQTQAWTVSALLRAILAQQGERPPTPTPLERELLAPGATERLRGRTLRAAFPTDYAFRVDTETGCAVERELLQRLAAAVIPCTRGDLPV